MGVNIGDIYFLRYQDQKTGEWVKRHPIVILAVNVLEDEVIALEELDGVRGTSNLDQINFPGVLVEPSKQNGLTKQTIFHLSPALKFFKWEAESSVKIGVLEDEYIRQISDLFTRSKSR